MTPAACRVCDGRCALPDCPVCGARPAADRHGRCVAPLCSACLSTLPARYSKALLVAFPWRVARPGAYRETLAAALIRLRERRPVLP